MSDVENSGDDTPSSSGVEESVPKQNDSKEGTQQPRMPKVIVFDLGVFHIIASMRNLSIADADIHPCLQRLYIMATLGAHLSPNLGATSPNEAQY